MSKIISFHLPGCADSVARTQARSPRPFFRFPLPGSRPGRTRLCRTTISEVPRQVSNQVRLKENKEKQCKLRNIQDLERTITNAM